MSDGESMGYGNFQVIEKHARTRFGDVERKILGVSKPDSIVAFGRVITRAHKSSYSRTMHLDVITKFSHSGPF